MQTTSDALMKTVGRTRHFIRHALVWREPFREYAVIGWMLVGGAAWLAMGVVTGLDPPLSAIWGCYLLALLVAICAIDARFGIIPDTLVVWLGVGGLLQLVGQDWETGAQRIAAGVVVFLGGCLVRVVYRASRGRDGLGFGDVKFLLAGAPWIGFEGLPALLLISVLSASVSLAILRAGGERLSRSDAISFGPHLAVALWLVWVVGPRHFAVAL